MSPLEDRYYLRLPAGRPVQGDIWTGIPGTSFAEGQVSGVIITPRCDLAHDKTRILNIVPIVSLDEHLELFGATELLEGEENVAEQGLLNQAKLLDVAELVELGADAQTVRAVVDAKLAAEPSEKNRARIESAYDSFTRARLKLSAIRAGCESSRLSLSEVRRLVPENRLRSFQQDVVRNRKADTYFLPPHSDLIPHPSVALLRYVVACSAEFLRSAESSASAADWERVRKRQLSTEYAAAPIAPERVLRLRTPYIESLMARFCALFGRVGTRDLEPSEIASFVATGGTHVDPDT